MATCPTVGTGGEFVSRAINFIDCHAMSLGQSGYLALAGPSSPLPSLLLLALTLFVAIYGFRMMLGTMPDIAEIIMSAVKVGFVLALAISWPTMRALLYDTILFGPEDLAAPIGVTGASPSRPLGTQLQSIDNGVVELTRWGTGRLDIQVVTSPDGIPAADAFRGTAIADAFAFGFGRYAFLASALGSLAFVRIGAGLLLALAPLFAGLLLFDATRSVFMGWLRALATLALSSLAIAAMLNIEMAILDPWLRDALNLRAANYAIASAPTELMVITSGFAIGMFAIIGLIGRLCFSSDISSWVKAAGSSALHRVESVMSNSAPIAVVKTGVNSQTAEPSRAFVIAEAVAGMQRREASATTARMTSNTLMPSGSSTAGSSLSVGRSASSGDGALQTQRARASDANRKRRVSGLGSKRDRTI